MHQYPSNSHIIVGCAIYVNYATVHLNVFALTRVRVYVTFESFLNFTNCRGSARYGGAILEKGTRS